MATPPKPVPSPMAHLQKATKAWQAFQSAVGAHATRTAGERARSDREQTDATEYHRDSETPTEG